ncbi:hypothetical protein MRBLMR1_000951 [Neorhizobium sp. LMR1-1-1.1]
MFEKILLRKGASAPEIDLGLLAEALLFYQDVHIIMDPGTALHLEFAIGYANLKRLADDGHASFSFFRSFFGASSSKQNGIAINTLVQFQSAGKTPNTKWSSEDDLASVLARKGYETKKANSAARSIIKLAPPELMKLSGKSIDVIQMANEDLRDPQYMNAAARVFLQDKTGQQIPPNWNFKAHEIGKGEFIVVTNYDFPLLSAQYQKLNQLPANELLTPSSVLAEVLEARADVVFASKYMAESVTTPTRSAIIQNKFELIGNLRRQHSQADIELFQEIHLNGNSLRTAINSGQRTFEEFLDLLDKTRKFKSWLKGVKPEAGLLKEYHDAVIRETWLERLPNKSSRFTVMTGAGAIIDYFVTGGAATVGALALGAADTFLVDRMLKGWRPNQFVEKNLTPFLQSENGH